MTAFGTHRSRRKTIGAIAASLLALRVPAIHRFRPDLFVCGEPMAN